MLFPRPRATQTGAMPGGRDSTIVKLEFSSGVSVPPPQAFTVLKDNGVEIREIEMLQALEARNTYDLNQLTAYDGYIHHGVTSSYCV